MKECLNLLAVQGLMAVAAASVTLLIYDSFVVAHRPKPLRIGLVDVAALVRLQEAKFSKVMTTNGVTDKQRDEAIAMTQTFSRQLSAALAAIPNECNCVLLASSAVVGLHGEVYDFTNEVMRRVGL